MTDQEKITALEAQLELLKKEPRHLGLMDLVERCEKAEAQLAEAQTYKDKYFQSNRNLHAAWARAEKAEAELSALHAKYLRREADHADDLNKIRREHQEEIAALKAGPKEIKVKEALKIADAGYASWGGLDIARIALKVLAAWGRSLQSQVQALQEKIKDLHFELERSGKGHCIAMRQRDIAESQVTAQAQEIKRLREAAKNLLVALAEELTGVPKNVPKSQWAAEWAAMEDLLKSPADPKPGGGA